MTQVFLTLLTLHNTMAWCFGAAGVACIFSTFPYQWEQQIYYIDLVLATFVVTGLNGAGLG
jgi:hypothetical protein